LGQKWLLKSGAGAPLKRKLRAVRVLISLVKTPDAAAIFHFARRANLFGGASFFKSAHKKTRAAAGRRRLLRFPRTNA